jgi:hypothetical protein
MKTLIITDSWDATSDIVIGRLGDDAFRINSDLIRDYSIQWDSDGFTISSPAGKSVSLAEIGSVYWRKPFTSVCYDDVAHPEYFFYSECRYLIRELYNVAVAAGAYALVEQGAERRLGKVRQLLLAKGHFQIPKWGISLGNDYTAPPNTIVKSLSGEQVDSDNVLYTTRVDGQLLDPTYVWFTQHAINKSADITVCFVDGRVFAFELVTAGESTDWRKDLDKGKQHWRPYRLSAHTSTHIDSFMRDCDLKYGRLDFVLDGEELVFLEVNPNGQWAWLDLDDESGLVSAVVEAVCGRGHNNMRSDGRLREVATQFAH